MRLIAVGVLDVVRQGVQPELARCGLGGQIERTAHRINDAFVVLAADKLPDRHHDKPEPAEATGQAVAFL